MGTPYREDEALSETPAGEIAPNFQQAREIMVGANGDSSPGSPPNRAESIEPSTGVPPKALAHDKDMAASFLAGLDPAATNFTFQFFSDGSGKYAEVFHGTLDEFWPKVQAVNTPERRIGAFVTINETDLKGRRAENIVRARALFADADGNEQVARCLSAIEACGATPSMVVKSGGGLHVYWVGSEIPRDQFSALQENLSCKLGTDGAVKDLPRVMRLPGTLHLKNPASPRLVKLMNLASSAVERWQFTGLAARLGLSARTIAKTNNVLSFSPPAWAINGRPSAGIADASGSLSAGLEANIEEVRSAASAIPPSAIATEPEWMRFARALAFEARISNRHEEYWQILEAASRLAPGYDEADNQRRWLRYIDEAYDRADPITIQTLLNMAVDHGWQGYSRADPGTMASDAAPYGPSAASAGPDSATANTQTPKSGSVPNGGPSPGRAVPVSSLPQIPPKRQWLHGNDLVRGAVTVLAAPGGRAKSTWLLTGALACASGRPLLGSHVFGGPLRVLCLSTEDGLSEMALRLRAAMKHHKLTDTDVLGLYVIGADRWGLPLLKAEGNRAVLDRHGMDALTAELDYIKPDVLIIDPLINVMGGVSANDNAAAALLMGQLVALATTRRISIALAHHTSKWHDPKSAESAMGAASFINLARIALAIESLDEDDSGKMGLPPWEASSVFRVLGTKQNFTPPNQKDRWFRIISVEMPNPDPPIYMTGDRVAVVEPFHPNTSGPIFPPDLIRDALAAIDSANPALSPSKQARDRYAAPVIAQAIASHRGGSASDAEGKSVLDHLLSSDLARVADIKLARSGSRGDVRKCLVLTPRGKTALNQFAKTAPNATPQSPLSPAMASQENAGGDPLGTPQPQGGCGGNAGRPDNGAESVLPSAFSLE